ncbi:hypothetical protein [Jiella pacifica]|uniref:Uncharacterized protein n=1 Tax=Jiella pacifica TaxID=2696469 RepID=A0A6N9SZ95_9HYPH|nr:hypothetical protein [Jiella pacifica]NDW03672.1 hypothetical protein [Jiella pacifica]
MQDGRQHVDRLAVLGEQAPVLGVTGRIGPGVAGRAATGVPGSMTMAEALELCGTAGMGGMIVHHSISSLSTPFPAARRRRLHAEAISFMRWRPVSAEPMVSGNGRRTETMNHPAEAAPPRNMLEMIRLIRPDLRKSDRKVADALLENPHRILNSSPAVSTGCRTSDSSG